MSVRRNLIARSVLAAMIGGAVSTMVRAQSPTTAATTANPDAVGATASACQNDASRWFNAAFTAASDSAERKLIKSIDFGALSSLRSQQLRQCVTKLDANQQRGKDLLDLARLSAQTGERDLATQAFSRYMNSTDLTDSLRAEALRSMARQYSTKAQDLPYAEPYVSQLDGLPNAALLVKRAAHEELFTRYQSLDLDLGSQKHALAVIALARTAKAQTRTREHPEIANGGIDASELMTMYQTAANVEGNFGREAAAIKLLEEARRDHPEISTALFDSGFSATVARLKLTGQHASAVTTEHWFNAPPDFHTASFTGNVTVLGFTAHWCPPCQATYVPLTAMSDSLSSRGARFMFVTTYYGYVGNKRNLKAEAEREETRIYYQGKNITFPIAMLGDGFDAVKFAQRDMPPAFASYFLEQIPQTVVIDRHGVIRRIIVGWDPANSERLPALLNALLREK